MGGEPTPVVARISAGAAPRAPAPLPGGMPTPPASPPQGPLQRTRRPRPAREALLWKRIEGLLVENWSGLLGVLVVVAGVTFVIINVGLQLDARQRFLLTLLAGAALAAAVAGLGPAGTLARSHRRDAQRRWRPGAVRLRRRRRAAPARDAVDRGTGSGPGPAGGGGGAEPGPGGHRPHPLDRLAARGRQPGAAGDRPPGGHPPGARQRHRPGGVRSAPGAPLGPAPTAWSSGSMPFSRGPGSCATVPSWPPPPIWRLVLPWRRCWCSEAGCCGCIGKAGHRPGSGPCPWPC